MYLFLGHTEVTSNLQPHYNPIKNSLQDQRQTHVVVLETQVDCLPQESVTFVPFDGHAPSFGTQNVRQQNTATSSGKQESFFG